MNGKTANTELSEEQITKLRQRLDEREQELKDMVQERVGRLRDIDAPGQAAPLGDVADQADIDQERGNENGAVVREMRELRDIETARQRIEAGDAGVCIDCGEQIPFERLMVQPSALRCVACQESNEREEALRAVPESQVAGARR